MNWPQIEEITYSECDNPHKLLGPHKQGSKMLVQAYFPGAEKVTIHWKKTGQVGEAFLTDVPMELADEEGYFGYHNGYHIYFEIISYKRLLSNAELRNKIFFRKLNID